MHNGGGIHERYGTDSIARKPLPLDNPSRHASNWLRENESIAIETSLSGYLEDIRAVFAKRKGRPTPAVVTRRELARSALQPLWESDCNRTVLAEVIGCSRKALYTLMSKRPPGERVLPDKPRYTEAELAASAKEYEAERADDEGL